MVTLWFAIGVTVCVLLAEWLHARKVKRVALLAFGPDGNARSWTRAVPFVRALGLGALTWGCATLYMTDARFHRAAGARPNELRHILIVLDVSPSMTLVDAGTGGSQTRTKRAAEVMLSVLDRVVLEQAKVSVVAFYTAARPVVVDAQDLAVVKNILSDLPLDQAFDHGQTSLFSGLEEAFKLAHDWRPGSTTLFLLSDGDTVPATGMPIPPPSVEQVIVIGVGDARAGKFIDGHTSRQDASTLRQVAARLNGTYYDANQRHISTELLADLNQALPVKDETKAGQRELALVLIGIGGLIPAALSVATALLGTAWHAGRRVSISATGKQPTVNS